MYSIKMSVIFDCQSGENTVHHIFKQVYFSQMLLDQQMVYMFQTLATYILTIFNFVGDAILN
jgi:hypothetical protein